MGDGQFIGVHKIFSIPPKFMAFLNLSKRYVLFFVWGGGEVMSWSLLYN